MPIWRLRTLGIFALTPTREAAITELAAVPFQVGFKNYRTWILLACLATDPSTCRRDAIAQCLWQESDTLYNEADYLTKLRPLLTDLVHGDKKKGLSGIGENCLIRHQKTLRLKPGTVITDVDEAEAMLHAAQALTDDNERILPLREAARQLHGVFLPGFDPPPFALSWYNTQTVRLEALRSAVWNALLDAAEKTGDTAVRAEAWQQLHDVAVSEDFIPCIKSTPNSAKFSKSATKNAPAIEWADLLTHLTQKACSGFPLTSGEEAALENALETTLAHLPPQGVTAFRALSVFPQSFTRNQASAVIAVSTNRTQQLLNHLIEAALVCVLPPAQEPETEHRYCLPPFVGPLVFQKLHSSQRKRLRLRHAQYFARFDGTGWPMSRVKREKMLRWFEEEQANYLQALEVCLESSLCDQTWDFIACLCQWAILLASDENIRLQRVILQRAVPRLKEAVESGQPFAYSPAQLLLSAAKVNENFPEAVHWATVALEHIQSNAAFYDKRADSSAAIRDLADVLVESLGNLHHAGFHQDFDTAIGVAWKVLEELPDDRPGEDKPKLIFQQRLLFIKAENCWTRGDLEAAFLASEACMECNHQLITLIPSLRTYYTPSYYQRGCIQWERGNKDCALADWNRALEGFQAQTNRHGIADCKKRIGKALAEMGHYAIGQDLVHEAIAIYAAQDKKQSRAAALGTLADILVMKGEAEKALAFYEEGLAFSRSTNHAGWIEHFETSLIRLGQSQHVAAGQPA